MRSTPLSEERTDENFLIAIDSADSENFLEGSAFSRMSLEIPYQLLELASNMSGVESIANVSAGSFLYDKVAGLFSGNLPGQNQ